jgi:hypothetical protein
MRPRGWDHSRNKKAASLARIVTGKHPVQHLDLCGAAAYHTGHTLDVSQESVASAATTEGVRALRERGNKNWPLSVPALWCRMTPSPKRRFFYRLRRMGTGRHTPDNSRACRSFSLPRRAA